MGEVPRCGALDLSKDEPIKPAKIQLLAKLTFCTYLLKIQYGPNAHVAILS